MEVFDISKHSCREFSKESMKELVSAMSKNVKVWSWGAKSYSNWQNKALAFRVSGHLHKGIVVLSVNGSDLFDVYLLNLKRQIKQVVTDVHVEDLITTIDEKVEKIIKRIL
jgi:hypothetical protein